MRTLFTCLLLRDFVHTRISFLGTFPVSISTPCGVAKGVNAQLPASQSRHFTKQNGSLHVPIDLRPAMKHPIPTAYTAGLAIRLGLEAIARRRVPGRPASRD